MPWVRFTADMDWKPKMSVTLGYRSGMVVNVPRACAVQALSEGKAVKLTKRSRASAPVEVRHDQ